MKILAIETTDQAGSVAFLEGRRVLAEARLTSDQRSAQSLAAVIRDLLEASGWQPAEIRLVAVAIGPGSFTGLRVGVTTAKTFAYAVGSDVVAVPTLEVVAAQMPEGASQLLTVLDAGRQQVFTARFLRTPDGQLESVEPTALVDDAVWLAGLRTQEMISGPGLRKFTGRLPDTAKRAPAELWAPQAATVGLLALPRFEAGQRDDLWGLVPVYHRASAAEEKLARLRR